MVLPRTTEPDASSDYYRRARPDLAAFLPLLPSGSRVLEIGCGEGRLGAQLRARGCEVHGVESVAAAAAKAARVLDRVHIGDIERLQLDYPKGHFHLLLCGDVLEHLVDPWSVLSRLRALLSPGGTLLVSVPNVQYFPVLFGLLCGRFEYRESGILDRTHLRFFTRREARRMIEATGFVVESMPVVFPFRARWLRVLASFADRLTVGVLRGLLTGQVYLRARCAPQ